jgi:hypothetical protein
MIKAILGTIALLAATVPGLATAQDYVDNTPYEVDSTKYPYVIYPSSYEMNNDYPWETQLVPFDPNRSYTPAEQDTIVNDEALLTGGELYYDFSDGTLDLDIAQATIPEATEESPSMTEFGASGGLETKSIGKMSCSPLQKTYSRTESFGNSLFGAGYSISSSLTETPPTPTAARKLDAVQDGRVTATVFSHQQQIVRGYAYVSGQQGGANNGSAGLYAMGQQIWSTPLSQTFSQTPINWSRTFYSVTKLFMVGPVPLLVKASIAGGVTYTLSGEVSPLIAKLVSAPGGFANIIASASVNIAVAAIGVTGTLSLLKVSVPATGELRNTLYWKHAVDLDLSTLSGTLTAFATVRMVVFKKTWNVTIAQWNGLRRTLSLLRAEGQC